MSFAGQFKFTGYYSNFNQRHNPGYFNISYQDGKNHKSKLTLPDSNPAPESPKRRFFDMLTWRLIPDNLRDKLRRVL